MERVIAFSMERVIAFSIERVLVRNALQLHRNFGVPLAFPQRSISRSICVPVTRSLLGYFCPVLYVGNKMSLRLVLGLHWKAFYWSTLYSQWLTMLELTWSLPSCEPLITMVIKTTNYVHMKISGSIECHEIVRMSTCTCHNNSSANIFNELEHTVLVWNWETLGTLYPLLRTLIELQTQTILPKLYV